jgi:hypothetical protein
MQTSVSSYKSEEYELYGVEHGARCCNLKRSSELNERISARNVPTAPLQPHFSVRPVSTKYDMMSIMDRRMVPTVPLNRVPTYDMKTNFNPGSAQGPWEGFATRINDESILRNQIFALQNCDKGVYVPPSTSDLYSVSVGGRNEVQTHPNLFMEQEMAPFNPNLYHTKVGHNMFHNSTRDQIKNV